MSASLTFAHLEPDAPAATLREAFDVMRELRPHLPDVDAFVAQLIEQRAQQYRLLAARDGARIVGLAGYRAQTNLLYGRFVYVDDLVVSAARQRDGIGAQLLDAVRQIARANGAARFVLDTGLGMPLAQRFYFRQGLLAKGMHFTQTLVENTPAAPEHVA